MSRSQEPPLPAEGEQNWQEVGARGRRRPDETHSSGSQPPARPVPQMIAQSPGLSRQSSSHTSRQQSLLGKELVDAALVRPALQGSLCAFTACCCKTTAAEAVF